MDVSLLLDTEYKTYNYTKLYKNKNDGNIMKDIFNKIYKNPFIIFNTLKHKKIFIKGLFENGGGFIDIKQYFCNICLLPDDLYKNKEDIAKYINIQDEKFDDNNIRYIGTNMLDFLSYIYDNFFIHKNQELYQHYVDLVLHKNYKHKVPECIFHKVLDDAVIPTKNRASDVGFDLTIIKEVKKISDNTILYTTGLKISPPFGYYTQIVGRSSISKSGYMLSNNIGIIDGNYTGELLICLTRIDNKIEPFTLPFKCAQLLLVKHNHYLMNEYKEFDVKTSRNDGGFGSTDK